MVLIWGGDFIGSGGFAWIMEMVAALLPLKSQGGEFGSFWCFLGVDSAFMEAAKC